MKKMILAAFAAFFSVFAVAQTTVSLGYENTRFSSAKENSHYQAIGLIKQTEYGSFDGYLQGSRFGSDSMAGVEVGYGRGLTVGSFGNFTRLAVGTMGNIEGVGRANYALLSTEFSHPIYDRVSAYVGASHTFALNDQAVSNNRLQLGVDVTLDKATSLRVGYSAFRQSKETLHGGVLYLNHSF